MKRSLSLVCLLASGLSASAFAQTSAAVPNAPGATAAATPAGPAKVAIIMFQPAVAQTNEGQRDFAEVRKKFEPKQTQLKTQSDEIDSLKKQMQTAGANLSEAERASRLQAIESKEKILQRDGEDAQNDFQQQIQQTYASLAEKVYASVQSYAEQNGYTLVVDASQQQSPVLWANPGTDITAPVIQLYNQKSGVPAPPPGSAPAAPAAAPRPRATTPR